METRFQTDNKNVSYLRLRLVLGFAAILILMALLTLLSFYGFMSMERQVDEIVNSHIVKLDKAVIMRTAARERTLSLHRMLLLEDEFAIDDEWMRFNLNGSEFAKARLHLVSMEINEQEKALLDEQGRLTRIAIQYQNQVLELIWRGKPATALEKLVSQVMPAQDAVLAQLTKFVNYQKARSEKAFNATSQAQKNSIFAMAIAAIIAGIIGLNIAIIVVRRSVKTEETLCNAYIQSQEAVAMKSQFMANMSHELRTPLNAIIGYADFLSEELEEQGSISIEYLDDVECIKTSGGKLLNMISMILELADIEDRSSTLSVSSFCISELLEEVAGEFFAKAMTQNNKIVIRCDEASREMCSDRWRIKTVLCHLLDNACRFTQDGEITLSAENTKTIGLKKIKFDIADTGIGILPEYQNTIFNPFIQADGAYTRKYEGVGLGLTMCKKICELLGGNIQLTSEYHKGSLFSVELAEDLSSHS